MEGVREINVPVQLERITHEPHLPSYMCNTHVPAVLVEIQNDCENMFVVIRHYLIKYIFAWSNHEEINNVGFSKYLILSMLS